VLGHCSLETGHDEVFQEPWHRNVLLVFYMRKKQVETGLFRKGLGFEMVLSRSPDVGCVAYGNFVDWRLSHGDSSQEAMDRINFVVSERTYVSRLCRQEESEKYLERRRMADHGLDSILLATDFERVGGNGDVGLRGFHYLGELFGSVFSNRCSVCVSTIARIDSGNNVPGSRCGDLHSAARN
jgi:hypothetical protein